MFEKYSFVECRDVTPISQIFITLNILPPNSQNKPKFRPNPKAKLMDQVREVLRFHHYAFRTEKAYCHWILRFIRFFECRIHPREMGPAEVERFLSHLATQRRVSAATKKQALNAIVFLYRDMLDRSLQGQLSPIRAKPGRRPPTVLTQAEAQSLLQELVGEPPVADATEIY